MNHYSSRTAQAMDKDFIFRLLEEELPNYHLHENIKNKFEAREINDQTFEYQYERKSPKDLDIGSVYIVINKGEQVGAYKFEKDIYGLFYRLFWMASILRKGVGTFVIDEIKKIAKVSELRTIKLSVNKTNTVAIKCYTKNGFTFINYEKSGQECEMTVEI